MFTNGTNMVLLPRNWIETAAHDVKENADSQVKKKSQTKQSVKNNMLTVLKTLYSRKTCNNKQAS